VTGAVVLVVAQMRYQFSSFAKGKSNISIVNVAACLLFGGAGCLLDCLKQARDKISCNCSSSLLFELDSW
jgi:hypothetical protein